MKRLFLFSVIIAAAMGFTGVNIFAQENHEKDVRATNIASKDKEKSKTEVFDIGQIVFTETNAANVELATTSTFVSAMDIEAREEKTLKDTLQMIPGVTTSQHSKGHIRFKMRGYDMDKVALLVDGIPITDVYESNIDISKIPVQNASQIIINRGTCSALYGTTGTVGSINIVTAKPTELYTKIGVEYGFNGDYNLNVAHGGPVEDFYYWITATVEQKDPYDVSDKLGRSERLKWYNKFIKYDLYGDSIDTGAPTTLYFTDTGEWPHQEMTKYSTNFKVGYEISEDFEIGLNTSYYSSESERYCISTDGTSEYDTEDLEWGDPRNSLRASSFTWPRVWNVTVAPYASYESGDFNIRGNIYYNHTYEVLDGYQDVEETIPARGWGSVHSNWQNTTAGFNIFPSYRFNDRNTLNSSILFRWDKHLEREKADSDFIGRSGSLYNNANSAYDNFGDSWFKTKRLTGKQITLAVEDQIDLEKTKITAGISYDAQKLETYKRRRPYGSTNWRTDYTLGKMESQYKPDEDSTIWGTRDSLNPVLSILHEPIQDFLLLRASYSQKTKLPTMAMYTNIYEDTDTKLDTEKSHNGNAGFELLFKDRTISVRTDLFYSRFKDKIEEIILDTGDKVNTNIDGAEIQGVEIITSGKFVNITDSMDLDVNLSYCFVQHKNLDDDQLDTEIYKGEEMEDNPEHQFIADFRLNFVTDTSLNIFGQYSSGAIKYAMKSAPDSTDPHTTSVYKEVSLNDSLIFNLKLSQKFMKKYEVYILCRNIFDDYAYDPFNPGPGRQFLLGAKAEF